MRDDCMPTKESSGCSLDERAQIVDRELDALHQMVELFKSFPAYADRQRMLKYLVQRFGDSFTR